jgi:hypothetical protein
MGFILEVERSPHQETKSTVPGFRVKASAPAGRDGLGSTTLIVERQSEMNAGEGRKEALFSVWHP